MSVTSPPRPPPSSNSKASIPASSSYVAANPTTYPTTACVNRRISVVSTRTTHCHPAHTALSTPTAGQVAATTMTWEPDAVRMETARDSSSPIPPTLIAYAGSTSATNRSTPLSRLGLLAAVI